MEQNNEVIKPAATEVAVVLQEKPALVDSALNFLHETAVTTYTAEEEKALIRKIDWMIMPLMGAVYFLQFIDKNLSTFTEPFGS